MPHDPSRKAATFTPNSPSLNTPPLLFGVALLLFAAPLQQSSPWATLWTTPAILAASLLITWGAESAQFFIAQGLALAMLALMQTLPEFAVEAVLAWKGQTDLLLANLTGALRLLTGLAWPMIFITASIAAKQRTGSYLRVIQLDRHHSVEVVGLVLPIAYAAFIWWKQTLTVVDAGILLVLYAAYVYLLSRLPPEQDEGIEELEAVPRRIVLAPKLWRNAGILGCFLVGGALIYITAEPFLGSLVSLAAAAGIPSFIVIQWLAPVISEFPELLSTFYFARQVDKAGVALMNIASSNINQWTLLVAMLPVVLSMGHGSITPLHFNGEQRGELLLTISQSLVGLLFLVNMEFAWWEALAMLSLFLLQFVLPPLFGEGVKTWIVSAFLIWSAVELLALLARRRVPPSLRAFAQVWREHV